MLPIRATRRHLGAAIVATIAAFAVTPNRADAALTLTLSDNVGDPTQVITTRGGSFTVDVTLTTDRPFTGVTFFLTAPGVGSSKFSITGRTTAATNPLSDPNTSTAGIVEATSALLDPRNNSDLGYSAAANSPDFAAGTYVLGTLTLKSIPSVPTVTTPYSIVITDAVIADASFAEYTVTGGSYGVLVPEPTTLAAVASIGTLALVRRRRALHA